MKIVIAGDGGVGKTSFIRNMKNNGFNNKYTSTVGFEVHPYSHNDTHMNIIDTAGNEKYASNDENIRGLCHDVNDVVLMFDVTHKNSYNNLNKWYNYYRDINPNIPFVVVGNKSDSENRRMNETNTTFHTENNLQYFEISSKTGHNVNTVFDYIVEHY